MNQKVVKASATCGREAASNVLRSYVKLILLISAVFTTPAFLNAQQNAPVGFTFNLNASSNTSAGVYKWDGTLVKTLWNNVRYNSGTHTAYWDRTNDDGTLLSDTGYFVKVVSNNITYNWEGVVGNNSDSVTGPSKIRAFERFTSMAVAGNYAYYAIGYAEGVPSCYKFDIRKPNNKINILKGDYDETDQQADYVATDGTNVYWAGYDPFNVDVSFVYATKCSNDNEYLFANGSSQSVTFGRTYSSAIDLYTSNSNAHPSGLAVQKNGAFLFVAHKDLDLINVFNKTSGAFVTSYSFTAPREICVDGNDRLWVISGSNTVEKYTVNTNGTLSSAQLSLSGLLEPLAMAVSPNNSKIAILDGASSQQIKTYGINSGSLIWTFGSAGGYINSPAVSDNKFYFNDSVTMLTKPFIAFQPDSSFWVGDVGNERVQHYSASKTFINRIMCLPHSYSTVVDKNDPTRVFNEFLEFKVDYSKTLAPNNGSWRLVNNWRRSLTADYYQHDKMRVFLQMTTLSNNRTYAILDKYIDDIRSSELVELPASGNLRFTGIKMGDFTQDVIEKDGSLRRLITDRNLGDSGYWEVQTLKGFSNNNPVWNSPSISATLPKIKADDPAFSNVNSPVVTSTGYNIIFNAEKDNKGYHLGAVKNGTGRYAWRTSKATNTNYIGPMPTDGSFDIGNNVEYPGGNVYAMDRNIFWNYHGEFWKNSQTNVWNHYMDNGLMLGQFGISTLEGEATVDEAPAMVAGNVFSSTLVKVGSDYYIYHNDECNHGGVHRWKISGLNTVAEQNIKIAFSASSNGGLLGRFFDGSDLNNFNLKVSAVSSTVNLSSAPSGISNSSNFSARWTGYIKPVYSQNYTFYTNVSKGVRLWINNTLVIDKWTNTSSTEFSSSSIKLAVGVPVAVRMEINGGSASLSWSSSSQTKQIIPAQSLFPSAEPDYSNGTDLMEGIDGKQVLETGLYGWTRNSNTEKYNGGDDYWNVKVNTKSFNRYYPDLQINFRDYNNNYSVSRDLGNPASCLNSWQLTGKIDMDRNFPNWDGGGTGYFDVLDDQGKIITRITHEMTMISNDNKPTQIKINGTNAVNMNEKDLYTTLNKPQNFDLLVSSTGVSFKFGTFNSVNAAIYDKTANWNKPKSVRFSFSGGDYDKSMGLQNLRFSIISAQKPSITATGKTTFCQGDSVKLTASTSSSYNWSTGAKTQSITVKSSGSYNVTVADANGCQSSANAVSVTVNANPVPSISPAGNINVCQGDSVTLSSSLTGVSYLWSNGKTSKSITVSNNGSFNIKVTDANGCSGTSTSSTVTLRALPTVSVSANGPLSFCQGKQVVLTANGSGTYLWSNGATTQNITVSSSGSYNVKLTDGFGCKNTSSSTVVQVSPYPVPTITVSGAKVFCEGDSVRLTSSQANVYQWSNGASTQSILVKTGGNYSVTAGDGNGCSAASSAQNITVNQLPVPVVTAKDNVLTSSYSSGNQWYLNGNKLNGETGQTLTTKESGIYKVAVVDGNSCEGFSSDYQHTQTTEPTGIHASDKTTFSVYPNPGSGVYRINSQDANMQVSVFDQNGKLILNLDNCNGLVDISNFANGIYVFRIQTETGNGYVKIIKQ